MDAQDGVYTKALLCPDQYHASVPDTESRPTINTQANMASIVTLDGTQGPFCYIGLPHRYEGKYFIGKISGSGQGMRIRPAIDLPLSRDLWTSYTYIRPSSSRVNISSAVISTTDATLSGNISCSVVPDLRDLPSVTSGALTQVSITTRDQLVEVPLSTGIVFIAGPEIVHPLLPISAPPSGSTVFGRSFVMQLGEQTVFKVAGFTLNRNATYEGGPPPFAFGLAGRLFGGFQGSGSGGANLTVTVVYSRWDTTSKSVVEDTSNTHTIYGQGGAEQGPGAAGSFSFAPPDGRMWLLERISVRNTSFIDTTLNCSYTIEAWDYDGPNSCHSMVQLGLIEGINGSIPVTVTGRMWYEGIPSTTLAADVKPNLQGKLGLNTDELTVARIAFNSENASGVKRVYTMPEYTEYTTDRPVSARDVLHPLLASAATASEGGSPSHTESLDAAGLTGNEVAALSPADVDTAAAELRHAAGVTRKAFPFMSLLGPIGAALGGLFGLGGEKREAAGAMRAAAGAMQTLPRLAAGAMRAAGTPEMTADDANLCYNLDHPGGVRRVGLAPQKRISANPLLRSATGAKRKLFAPPEPQPAPADQASQPAAVEVTGGPQHAANNLAELLEESVTLRSVPDMSDLEMPSAGTLRRSSPVIKSKYRTLKRMAPSDEEPISTAPAVPMRRAVPMSHARSSVRPKVKLSPEPHSTVGLHFTSPYEAVEKSRSPWIRRLGALARGKPVRGEFNAALCATVTVNSGVHRGMTEFIIVSNGPISSLDEQGNLEETTYFTLTVERGDETLVNYISDDFVWGYNSEKPDDRREADESMRQLAYVIAMTALNEKYITGPTNGIIVGNSFGLALLFACLGISPPVAMTGGVALASQESLTANPLDPIALLPIGMLELKWRAALGDGVPLIAVPTPGDAVINQFLNQPEDEQPQIATITSVLLAAGVTVSSLFLAAHISDVIVFLTAITNRTAQELTPEQQAVLTAKSTQVQQEIIRYRMMDPLERAAIRIPVNINGTQQLHPVFDWGFWQPLLPYITLGQVPGVDANRIAATIADGNAGKLAGWASQALARSGAAAANAAGQWKKGGMVVPDYLRQQQIMPNFLLSGKRAKAMKAGMPMPSAAWRAPAAQQQAMYQPMPAMAVQPPMPTYAPPPPPPPPPMEPAMAGGGSIEELQASIAAQQRQLSAMQRQQQQPLEAYAPGLAGAIGLPVQPQPFQLQPATLKTQPMAPPAALYGSASAIPLPPSPAAAGPIRGNPFGSGRANAAPYPQREPAEESVGAARPRPPRALNVPSGWIGSE